MSITVARLSRSFGPLYKKLSQCGDELTIAERMVLINLLERLGQSSTTWPSRGQIASDLGISASSVDRAIHALKAKGWLSVRRPGQGRPNTYTIEVESLLDWAETGDD